MIIISKEMNKPKRIRIYKLSTFDTLTEEERKFNDAYKRASKDKALLKEKRDEEISKFQGVRKIERNRLYSYEYDEQGKLKQETETEDTDKQIALFESEMARLATDFKEKNPLVMEIVYLKIANQNIILKQIIDRGLDIDGKHYIFYSSTTNQMKRGEVILINEEFYDRHERKFMCGLTNEEINAKGGCNSGKYLAYKGLPLSTSFLPEGYEIDIDKCLVVPDFETVIAEEVECIDHNDTEITGIKIREEDITIPQTDGAGMFLPGVLPYSAQIRCGHLKGCIFPFDFRKFLMQDSVEGIKPSPVIPDAWGKVKHDVIKEDIQVLFTASQIKLWKYYDSWDDFKKAFKENGMRIAVNKFADTEPKGYAKTSYQFIQTLSSEKLTNDMIEKICKDTIEYLKALKTDVNKVVDILGDDYIADALKAYPELIQDKYVQSKIEKKFRSERDDARGNKLILKDSLYSYICPDLYAFCEWLFCGIKNPKGIVPRNHVYNSFFAEKEYNVVDCLRSPHLYMEHGIRKLVKGKELELCKEWFNDFDTVVSGHDLLCRVLMFDVDGDEILLTPNEDIITCVPESVHTLYYKSFDADKTQITGDTIYKALVSSMENSNIGDISNAMTKNYNNENTDETFNKVMCCFNNLTIDFPKTQKNISLGSYEEKYNQLLGEKAPYFFHYAKGKDRKNCKKSSNSNCDRICQYIHKQTGNKEYEWKNKTQFDPSILFNQKINVDIKNPQYKKLEELMFKLKQKEQLMAANIDSVIKNLSKSEGIQEKISRYVVFYDMCEKMILSIFPGERHVAAEYLLDFEYLQRDNESYGKNILWNCFGDLILGNIYDNLKLPNIRERRKHYTTKIIEEQKKIEKIVARKIVEKSKRKIPIEKEELVWINHIHYRKNCSNDRELLFILLFLNKRDGKVWVSSNKKNSLTCNKFDKWIGNGVSIAKKGIQRLQNMGVIEIAEHGKDKEIHVNIPEFESNTIAYDIPATAKNPLLYFYKHNKERVIAECKICKELFIKIGNKKTCSDACGNELERRRKRKVS